MGAICVGENIRRYRKGRGLSQQRLAMISGVARRTIAKYELNPRCNMETARLERLAEALEISMADLFRSPGDEQDMQSRQRLLKRALGASGAILLIIAIVALSRAQATPEYQLAKIESGLSAWQVQKPEPPKGTAPSGEQQATAEPSPGQPQNSTISTDPDPGTELSFYRSDNPAASQPAASTPAVNSPAPPAGSPQSNDQPAAGREPAVSPPPEQALDTAGKSGKVPPGQLKKNI